MTDKMLNKLMDGCQGCKPGVETIVQRRQFHQNMFILPPPPTCETQKHIHSLPIQLGMTAQSEESQTYYLAFFHRVTFLSIKKAEITKTPEDFHAYTF